MIKRYVHVDKSDLGELFIDDKNIIWKMIAYCDKPQATFEKISDTHTDHGIVQKTHVVGCPNHADMNLKRLRVVDE